MPDEQPLIVKCSMCGSVGQISHRPSLFNICLWLALSPLCGIGLVFMVVDVFLSIRHGRCASCGRYATR